MDFGEAHKVSVTYVKISCAEYHPNRARNAGNKGKGKGKGKVHPRTGHEAPEGEWKYSSTLSSTSALDGVGG
jgi:hypothetical protein